MAIVSLLRLRQLQATAVVLGECSSPALLIFAACPRRIVTPHSTFLFHRMRWQSDKRVASEEARHWASHFEQLETDLDALQTKHLGASKEQIATWIQEGRYLNGREIAAAG